MTAARFLDCPSAVEIKMQILLEASKAFAEDYISAKTRHGDNYGLIDFCIDQYIRIQDVDSENSFTYPDVEISILVGLTRDESVAIKVCMNSDEFNEDLLGHFLEIGSKLTRGGDSGNETEEESDSDDSLEIYNPLLLDILFTKTSLNMLVNVDHRVFSVKMYRQGPGNPIKNNPMLPGSIALQNNAGLAQNNDGMLANRPEYVDFLHSVNMQYVIEEQLSMDDTTKDYFVKMFNRQDNNYPQDVSVSEFTGETLLHYFDELDEGTVDPINEVSRVELYKRLSSIFLAVETKGYSMCDLGPENIVFDPKDMSSVRIFGLEKVVYQNEKCLSPKLRYAPPKAQEDRTLYNIFINLRNSFVHSGDIDFMLGFIEKIKKYYKDKIELYLMPVNGIDEKDFGIDVKKSVAVFNQRINEWDETAKFIGDHKNSPDAISDDSDILGQEFNSFFKENGLVKEILVSYDPDSQTSVGFNGHILGLLIFEFELKTIDALNHYDHNDSLAEEFFDIINAYNQLDLSKISRNLAVEGKFFMTSVLKQVHVQKLLNMMPEFPYFINGVLEFVNANLLVERYKVGALEEVDRKFEEMSKSYFRAYSTI